MNSNKTYNQVNDISLGNSAIIAGIGILIMAIIAPIAHFLGFQNLIVSDNAALTVDNIVASEGLFRFGICAFVVIAVLDIVVAWALYVFLKPVNKSLSLLTAWFRIVYATILSIVLIYLIIVLQLLNSADYISSFATNQIHAQVMLALNTFSFGWELGLIIFGFHLFLLGYLVLKAGFMRKILGILLILASLGYLIDGFGKLLFTNYNISIVIFTFIGEVVLIFWLLIKGRKINDVN